MIEVASVLLGVGAAGGGIAAIVAAYFFGRACLTWAQRCDPNNPSFEPPRFPGRKSSSGDLPTKR